MWYIIKLLPLAAGYLIWQLQPIKNFHNGWFKGVDYRSVLDGNSVDQPGEKVFNLELGMIDKSYRYA